MIVSSPNVGPDLNRFGPIGLVVVQSTSLCNLDCSYCYLPDRQKKRVFDLLMQRILLCPPGLLMQRILLESWISPSTCRPTPRINNPAQPHRGGHQCGLQQDCSAGISVDEEQEGIMPIGAF